MVDIEPVSGKAIEGITGLLLAPFFFVTEIFGVLMPGALFFVLLCAKGNPFAEAVLRTGIVGYRTKLVVCLLVSYFLGKVLSLPESILTNMMVRKAFPKKAEEPEKNELRKILEFFVGGAIILPLLFGRSRTIDYIAIAYTDVAFHTTSGFALLAASAIPGDGSFRYVELIVGVAMFLVGLQKAKGLALAVAAFLGMSVTDLLAKLPPSTIAAVIKAALAEARKGEPSLKQAEPVGTESGERFPPVGRQNSVRPRN